MLEPKCPLCGRNLEEPVVWEVRNLDDLVHTEARGDCEIHGSLYVRSTQAGGWLEIR